MRFGFHISIAGGFSKVIERAQAKECETIQLFSRNPRAWAAKELDPDDVAQFQKELAASNIDPVFVHAPYLVNLASADDSLFLRSVSTLALDVHRASHIGAGSVIVHVGKSLGVSEQEALRRVADGIDRSLSEAEEGILLLIENTAGQGSEIGYRFEQLAQIRDLTRFRDRVGFCLDTAHAFGAGYDWRTPEAVDATIAAFDRYLGLRSLHLLHLNDSKRALGSHRDRHWHIGRGEIGENGFRSIVRHRHLQHLPAIMETPRKTDQDDLVNMRTVRQLAAGG
jgi:deoxyribonuclease-4